MRYLDCLIAEADMLFTRDDREPINEAAQLYVLAAQILGDRPELLPAEEAQTPTVNTPLGRITVALSDNLRDPLTSSRPRSPSCGLFST
jgi:hypothetical protein